MVCLAVVRLVHLSQRGLAFVCMPVLPTTSRAAIPFSLAGDDEDLAKMMMVTCLARTRSNQFHPFVMSMTNTHKISVKQTTATTQLTEKANTRR